jgi:hypothetical protein
MAMPARYAVVAATMIKTKDVPCEAGKLDSCDRSINMSMADKV